MKIFEKKSEIVVLGVLIVLFSIVFSRNSGYLMQSSLFIDFDLKEKKLLSQNVSIEDDLNKKGSTVISCDVVIAGGGAGGTAAAIQAGRLGARTCLIEETDWLGGMLTAAGVSGVDGDPAKASGIFREFLERVSAYYESQGQIAETRKCDVSPFCFEPSVGNLVLNQMVSEVPNIHVYYNSIITNVFRDGDTIKGVKFKTNDGSEYVAAAHVTVDATEFGDLMFLGNVPYDIGTDKNSKEPHSNIAEQCIQPLTYVVLLKDFGKDSTIEKPKDYSRKNYKCTVKNDSCPKSNSKFDMNRLMIYGLLPNDKLMINIPSHSYGNDFHATKEDLDQFSREDVLNLAKEYTKGYIYFLQTELGLTNYGLVDEFNTPDGFAKMPYVRESRRLQGVYRMLESDVLPNSKGRAKVFEDSIAIGDYPIDLHFCTAGTDDIFYAIPPYQIPYGVTIPRNINGFMVAEKNISVSHLVNGTTRLQPVVMQVGQAVGAAAAISVIDNVQPKDVPVSMLQDILVKSGSKIFYFADIPDTHFAYPYVTKLALKKIFPEYSSFDFNPEHYISRAEVVVMIAKASGINQSEKYKSKDGNYRYEVAAQFLKDEGVIDNLFPIDSPDKFIKRGELSHLISRYVNDLPNDYVNKSLKFEDIDFKNTYYIDINKLANLGVIGTSNKKFRPNDKATRAEVITMLGKSMKYSTFENFNTTVLSKR